MKGSELKEILRKEGVVLMQLAEDLGMSQQNLSTAFTRDDVKSGLIEKIAKTLEKPVGYFYGEAERSASYESFSSDFIGSTDKLIDLLRVKDEQLTLAMQQTSTAQDQTTEALAQMRQIIERLPRQNPTPPIVTIETGTSQQGVHLKTGGLPTSSVRRTTSRRSIGGKGKLVTSKKD